MNARAQKLSLFGVLAAVMAGFLWVVVTQGPMATVRVATASAAQGTLQPEIFGIGVVEARYAYAVGPTQSGRVKHIFVDQGDRVRAGQVVAEMDAVDLDMRLAAAEFARQRAAHNVEAAAASLHEVQSRKQMAEASAKRYAELGLVGFVSAEAVDARRHDAAAAVSAVAGARAQLAAAQRDLSRVTAEHKGLSRLRGDLLLKSPADSLVIARDVEPGSTVVPGQAVLRMVQSESYWVRARIDQGRAEGIAVGHAAEIALRSRPSATLQGHVARIEEAGDPVTEERMVNIAFDGQPAGVPLGDLAEVTVRLPAVQDAVWIPSAALGRADGQHGVWQIRDGRAHFVPISTGVQTLDGRTQVLSGLAANDEVVLYSPLELSAGQKVKADKRLSLPGLPGTRAAR